MTPETPDSTPDGVTPGAEAPGTVMVARIAPGSPLATAGLAVGDRLVAWRHGGDDGDSTTPSSIDQFDDVWEVEIEAATRNPVTLLAERAGRRLELPVPAGRWRLDVRPGLDRSDADLLDEDASDEGRERATAALEAIRDRAPSPQVATWASWRLARLPSSPERHWVEALSTAGRVGDRGLEAWLYRERCLAREADGRLDEADADCGRCASLRETLGQELLAAECRYRSARIAGRRGDPAEEERRFRDVLSRLDRAAAAQSLLAVRALHGVAKARATQDDLAESFTLARRALAIAEAEAPGGLDHQASEMILGIFHWFASEWHLAEMRLRRSLEILEAVDPEHEDVANALNNLGLVAGARGDVAAAEDYYRRSLEVRERVAPDPLQASRTLGNLATLAETRGDLATAVEHDRRVLALRRELAPDSIDVATPLLNLGGHLVQMGELEEAERHLLAALELQRRHVPGSRDVCNTLDALGNLRREQGELDAARTTLEEALALCSRQAPGSALEAQVLADLGTTLLEAGELDQAERFARRAADVSAQVVPATLIHALHRHLEGRVLRALGRDDEAVASFRAAVEALDRQLDTLGGSDEERAGFRASWRHVYRDLADLLLESGEAPQAFRVLEQARARAFLALVRHREVQVTGDLSEELAADVRSLRETYDGLQERLAVASATGDRARSMDLRHELRELQRRRDRLAAAMRRQAPRLGELDAAYGVEEARRALPAEVTAISYSVDDTGVRAWVLARDRDLEVVDLAVTEAELRDLVDRFRLLVGSESSSRSGQHRALAARLHRILLEPLGAAVAEARRLVVVPDGPLHHLPFGALVVGGPEGPYLLESASIQIASSITAWGLLARRPPERAPAIAAFADPAAGAQPIAAAQTRDLGPLPAARRELEVLRRLYGKRVLAHAGPEATERAAKSVAPEARILHFATHAWVDPRSPLDSALLLVPSEDPESGRHNGLLQAWEVMQSLRLDATLVTLSACETGSGPVVGDEGILGLTRAFQFAGARGVVASLWRVPDRPTARLMEGFYVALSRGRPTHEALRDAQLAMIHSDQDGIRGLTTRLRGRLRPRLAPERSLDPSHPYAWSGFQLYGASPVR